MKLYDLANDLQIVRSGGIIIDDETGEILFDGENINDLEATMAEKVEGVLYYANKRETTAENLRAEAKRLTDWAKTLENDSKRLKSYALEQVQRVGGKLDTERYRVSIRRSKVVQILDMESIPSEFKVPQPAKPDKQAIKNAIMDGTEVPGASIVENISLSVR